MKFDYSRFKLPTDKFGGRDLSVGALDQPHDKISFSVLLGPVISEKCAELYASGLSLEAVASELDLAKSSVLGHLRRLGIPTRPSVSTPAGKVARKQGKLGGYTPYGYTRIRSRLVMDPKEMEVVRQMLALWNSGKSFCSIAKTLDFRGIKTRRGKPWKHPTVAAIIRRESNRSIQCPADGDR